MIPLIEDEYEIVSVDPADPPEHLSGTGWHRYVIAHGENTIRGYQRGSLEIVRQSVEEIVMRLNERRFGKRGRVHLDTSNHRKKGERN